MNGIYNLGLKKFLSFLGMRGFEGVWRPLTCGNRPVSNRNLFYFVQDEAKLGILVRLCDKEISFSDAMGAIGEEKQ